LTRGNALSGKIRSQLPKSGNIEVEIVAHFTVYGDTKLQKLLINDVMKKDDLCTYCNAKKKSRFEYKEGS
jgi:hypothetical protein